MGLFASIYNKVANFFNPQEPMYGEASKAVASNRLKLVLMQDRTNLTPKVLEQMRSELIDLLSKYLEMDKDMLELNFEQEGDQVALMLSIPVIRAKDEEEIKAALSGEENSEEDTVEAEEDEEVETIENSEASEEQAIEDDQIEAEIEDKNDENSEEDEEVVEYFEEEDSDEAPVKYTKGKKVTTPNPFKAEESDDKNSEVSVEK